MQCNVNCRGRRHRGGCPRLLVEPLLQLLGIVLLSAGLLCSGVGCGRKGPLKPLKKDAPPYNFMQSG
jgi:hypothetical protein